MTMAMMIMNDHLRMTVLWMTGVLLIVGSFAGPSSAFVNRQQSNHHSESGYSSSSSHHSNHAYSYSSHSASGPGYSYSYSSSGGGSPLLWPGYAGGFHSYTPLFLSSIDLDLLDLELDPDLDPDFDFDIDTDLDLDIDLDFPGIGYGLGYVGKYGHWLRVPKYGPSRLYRNVNSNLHNYGGRYGYDHLGSSDFGLLNYFK